MSEFCLCLFLWDATLEQRKKFKSMHKWFESFVTKGLSFPSLPPEHLWSCHQHTHNPPPPPHTHTHTRFSGSPVLQINACAHPALCDLKVSMSVYVPLCATRCMWHDQRFLCRRQRTENPFIKKTNLSLLIHAWIDTSPQLKQRTPGTERGGQRQMNTAADKK